MFKVCILVVLSFGRSCVSAGVVPDRAQSLQEDPSAVARKCNEQVKEMFDKKTYLQVDLTAANNDIIGLEAALAESHVPEGHTGQGHSAAVWLSAKPDLHLVAFDLGTYPFTLLAIDYFGRYHPGRISFVMGNSTQTVPMLRRLYYGKCDLLVVDGGHDFATAHADLNNFRRYARPNFNVMVMDDVNCLPMFYCQGPERALQGMVKRGAVQLIANFSMSFNQGQHLRGFSVGRFTAQLPVESPKTKTDVDQQSSAR